MIEVMAGEPIHQVVKEGFPEIRYPNADLCDYLGNEGGDKAIHAKVECAGDSEKAATCSGRLVEGAPVGVSLMRLNRQAKPRHRMSCRSLNIILNRWRVTERF